MNNLLEQSVYAALETYSNVHRGSGHYSRLTTSLYEKARSIVLTHLGLNHKRYLVIFCSPVAAGILLKRFNGTECRVLSSEDLGLSIGVRAIVAKKGSLPSGPPGFSGGGTTKLISREWVIWDRAPSRFEAGTPAIINVIAFARALQLDGSEGGEQHPGSFKDASEFMEYFHRDAPGKLAGRELLEELRSLRCGKELKVPSHKGETEFINLDNGASTPTFMPVWEIYRRSLYLPAEASKEVADEVRGICAEFLGAPREEYDIFFTSNTTEAINLLSRQPGIGSPQGEDQLVLGSVMEHSSNDLPWRKGTGNGLLRLNVNQEGFINIEELRGILEEHNSPGKQGTKRIGLVVLSAASNVIGTVNDIAAVSSVAHEYNAQLLVDGAQLVAHRKVNISSAGIDYFVFSGHKIYAPFGCGVLAARKGLILNGETEGAETRKLGEENTAGIASLGKALQLLKRVGMGVIEQEERIVTKRALEGLGNISGLTLYGIQGGNASEQDKRVGVIAFNSKDLISFRVGKELAAYGGVGVRVGCHCAHIMVKHLLNVGPGLEKFQRTLQILVPSVSFPGVVRISFGIPNTIEHAEVLLNTLREMLDRKRKTGIPEAGKDNNMSREKEKRLFKEQMNEFIAVRTQMVYGLGKRQGLQ